jgi:hypothetical protein
MLLLQFIHFLFLLVSMDLPTEDLDFSLYGLMVKIAIRFNTTRSNPITLNNNLKIKYFTRDLNRTEGNIN